MMSSRYPHRHASVGLKFGSMYQKRSTKRMNNSQLASHTSVLASRLKERESSNRNGTAKWKTTSTSATACQPEYKRRVKNRISGGRFPAQMISNCEKLKYAQSMTNVSMSFPWSCTSLGFKSDAVGSYFERIVSTMTITQSADSNSPTMKMNP